MLTCTPQPFTEKTPTDPPWIGQFFLEGPWAYHMDEPRLRINLTEETGLLINLISEQMLFRLHYVPYIFSRWVDLVGLKEFFKYIERLSIDRPFFGFWQRKRKDSVKLPTSSEVSSQRCSSTTSASKHSAYFKLYSPAEVFKLRSRLVGIFLYK
jgi:hypothetical protein